MPRNDSVGARAAGGGDEKGGGLMKKLLALLVLLVLIVLLILLLRGCGDDEDSSTSGGAKASLKAGGKPLLPVPASGLASLEGQKAKGTALEVVEVNGNQGFSVGQAGSDPVYIEWGGDVGRNEGSVFQPEKGQKVDLTGPVQAAGAPEIRKLKLDAAEAKLVRQQGAFVNADRVVQSK